MDEDPPRLPPAVPNSRPPVHPARGWLLVVLGSFLIAGMAFLLHWLQQTLLHNADPGARSHWNGSAEFTRNVFGLFWSVLAFGLVAVTAGVYILRTRRISRVLFGIMLVVAAAMIYFGYTITAAHVPR